MKKILIFATESRQFQETKNGRGVEGLLVGIYHKFVPAVQGVQQGWKV